MTKESRAGFANGNKEQFAQLMYLIKNNDLPAIQNFLDKNNSCMGWVMNDQDFSRNPLNLQVTPLICAIKDPDVTNDVIKFLIEKCKAPCNFLAKVEGKTQPTSYYSVYDALFDSIELGRDVKELLPVVSKGLNNICKPNELINNRAKEQSSLVRMMMKCIAHPSSNSGQLDFIKELVQCYGVDINFADSRGNTIVSFVEKLNNEDLRSDLLNFLSEECGAGHTKPR